LRAINAFKIVNQSGPSNANPGEAGEETVGFWFRLKVIADAGLVGLPNAGEIDVSRGSIGGQAQNRGGPDFPLRPLQSPFGVMDLGPAKRSSSQTSLADRRRSRAAGLGHRFSSRHANAAAAIHASRFDATTPDLSRELPRSFAANWIKPSGEGLTEKPGKSSHLTKCEDTRRPSELSG